jgi:hypothetical protein
MVSCSSGFETWLLRREVVSPSPNPQPGGPRLRIFDPPQRGWPKYTPIHWVAPDLKRATSRTHNTCESLGPKLAVTVDNIYQ